MTAGEKIALPILFILVTIDHDRLRRFWFGAALFCCIGGFGLGIWITDNQRQALRVRRPFVALQPPLYIGKLHGLAATPVEQPYLIALGAAGPRRRKREILPIRTPTRRRFALLAPRHLACGLTIQTDHPDVRI